MPEIKINKVPALRCPQCKSDKVKAGFSKRKRNAWVRDGKIYCYDCNTVTLPNGKTEELMQGYRSHVFLIDEGQE